MRARSSRSQEMAHNRRLVADVEFGERCLIQLSMTLPGSATSTHRIARSRNVPE
ncbi:MAG: hypothetical protein ACK4ZN_06255 [Oceanibaculum sp.]